MMHHRSNKRMYKRAGRKYFPSARDFSEHTCVHTETMWEYMDDSTYLEVYMGASDFDDVFGEAGKVPGDDALVDEGFMQTYPTLHMMLTRRALGNGQKRQVCTLTLVCEDGVVKCGLKERDRGLSLWVSCGSIGGVFATLEEALGERPAKWRKVDTKYRAKGS